MPIIAKHVVEARRAARLAAEQMKDPAASSVKEAVEPAPEAAAQSAAVPMAAAAASLPTGEPSTARSQQRGHAVKDETGKWQPTAGYDTGFCKPPEATRFKKGGKGGPGRPKGSVSHDTLLKRELEQKQRVRINGRERNVTLRELIVKKTVLAAVEGKDRHARKHLLDESRRLYEPEEGASQTASGALTASDALSMDEFMAEMRRDVRAEIERELAADGRGQ